jgi:hypothetical protein
MVKQPKITIDDIIPPNNPVVLINKSDFLFALLNAKTDTTTYWSIAAELRVYEEAGLRVRYEYNKNTGMVQYKVLPKKDAGFGKRGLELC